MIVIKSGGIVTGGKMTNAEKKAYMIEVKKMIAEHTREHYDEIDSIMLWALHESCGFGEKRLHDVYMQFAPKLRELCDHYMISSEEDEGWVCKRMLKEDGIDISGWAEESRNRKE